MSILENTSTDGAARTAQRKPKQSEPKPAPSEPSTQKSHLQHKQLQPATNAPRTEADKLRDVQALMRGDRPAQPDEEDTASSGQPEPQEDTARAADRQQRGPNGADDPDLEAGADGYGDGAGGMSIKDLATQLGTTPKKLYESLQITTGDGEVLSLGEVKDRITTQEAATREIVQRENSLNERESAILQNMQVLQAVYSDLEGKLSPQTVQRLQAQRKQKEDAERRLMLGAMPELQDPAKLDQFRQDVAETMSKYGFRPNELVIQDHRIALAIKDLIQTKRQLDKLMAFDPEAQAAPPRSQRPQGRRKLPNQVDQAISNARNGTQADKVAGVSAVLRKGVKRNGR